MAFKLTYSTMFDPPEELRARFEAQETADFFSGHARELERNAGYDQALPDDPLPGFRSRNRSVLKPYGVWGVITPFNFPLALAGSYDVGMGLLRRMTGSAYPRPCIAEMGGK